ncbi:MAG: plastocyanin/azurin family copper-binding protein [Burkholderiales bacterium]
MPMSISRQFFVSITMVILLAPLAAVAHTEAHTKKSSAAPAMVETDFGRTGDTRRVGRTIVVMLDDTMRFTPGELVIKQGETIRFVIRNRGKVMHEMVLGREEELKAHALLMQKHPDMEHDEPYMAHVAPGKEAAMIWQFTRPGEFLYGCLVPGHFEAGMVGRIKVLAR